jgi:hypothetical protein
MGMGHLPPAPPAEHGPYIAAIHRQLPPQPAAAAAARTPLEQPGHYKRGPSASVTLIGLLTHVCSGWLFEMIVPWPGLDWTKYSTEQPAPPRAQAPSKEAEVLTAMRHSQFWPNVLTCSWRPNQNNLPIQHEQKNKMTYLLCTLWGTKWKSVGTCKDELWAKPPVRSEVGLAKLLR